jgi:uncharacterized damage-inducible protein DinB
LKSLKYPIGEFDPPEHISNDQIEKWISSVIELPEKLSKKVLHLSFKELDYPYRPEGWNIKQVIHHIADSHMNSFIRFKLGITEKNPTIRPYNEDDWARTQEADNEEISNSLDLIKALHHRWGTLLRSMKEEDWDRTIFHPEKEKKITLRELLGSYAWHGDHHLAQIDQALAFKGVFEEAAD